ncbi:MAG: NnrU family protein [Burkholderiaceae bacterium]
MGLLIAGLVVFLGVHLLRVFSEEQRTRLIQTYGALAFKGAYSIVSVVGFILIVAGYAAARTDPVILYTPPTGMAHAASLFTLVAFVLLVAAYIPGNWFLLKLKHPMTLAVKTWAFGHLLANGGLHDLLLFGGFLAWSILIFRSARKRMPVSNPGLADGLPAVIASKPASLLGTLATLAIGLGAWAWFAFQGHALLIGVAPFAR